MIRVSIFVFCLLFPSLTLAQENASAPDKEEVEEKPLSFWMQMKIEASTDILRSLATEDFAKVKEAATRMRMLNKVEGFVRRRHPEYREQVKRFEAVTDGLIRQADKKNVEGIALEFTQLSLSCIECHRVLRAIERPEKKRPASSPE